jgi:hypothetical protein
LRLVHAQKLEVYGGGCSIGLRNCEISSQFIVHTRKNSDVSWLLDEATCLNREPMLDPNALYIDNRSCVDSGDGRVSDETDYQQSYPESYEFELQTNDPPCPAVSEIP